MSTKLLIGFDGSEFAFDAISDLRYAGLPSDVDAVVLTVAAVSIAPAGGSAFNPESIDSSSIVRMADKLVRQALSESEALANQGAQAVRALFPTWTVNARVLAGSPGTELIREAGAVKPNLIVIGARGKSSVAQMIEQFLVGLGSVSHKVIRFAPCSVRVGRRTIQAESGHIEILVCVDGSDESLEAVRAVATRDWPTATHVTVAAVIEPSMRLPLADVAGETPWTGYAYEDAGGFARRAVDRAAEILREKHLSVAATVLEGDAKYVLLQEASQRSVQTIFVGAQGLSRFERLLLGSVSAAIAERATCSVEVVR